MPFVLLVMRTGLALGLCWISTLAVPSLAAVTADSEPSSEPIDPVFLQALDFRMVGPHRGGRVTAVSGVIQQPNVSYMGATGGGVWKSTDYGAIWRNVSDGYYATGSIGAIDVADSDPNVVYVGTGSACIRSNVITGRGVYRSTDAGATWTFLGLPESGAVGDIVVHPRDSDRVYVAALGHPFGPNEERGVFRSLDGGDTWEKVLYISEKTGAVDLAINPKNPRHMFASMWRAERKPWTIISGAEEGGLYRTTNGGDSWTKVEKGLPQGLIGKIAVEISPANPKRVFALVEALGEERGLYRSDDGGDSFEMVNGQTSLTYRPWYYTHLTADPKDQNTLYVNNETLWVTVDAGKSFSPLRTPHGDNHDLWIHPQDPDLMVQGNDGGANVSQDGGQTWSTQTNQPTAELYQVEVDHQFPYRLYGAQQDNSTISVPSKVSRRPLDPKQDWYSVSGCETGPVVPDPNDANIIYGGCKGRHSVYDHRTGQTREYWVYPHYNYGHDTKDMPYRFQRTAPMILSPHDASLIYHGSQYLHRSRDQGRTWETISPDLTRNDPETQGYSGGPITRDITGEEIYSTIYALAESPLEEGVLWVGANDGPIHISRDSGDNWSDVTPRGLPSGGRVNRIEASPHARGRAYAAIYRFQLDDWEPYIYRTDDYGKGWRRLTNGKNGIPADYPVRVVREDPDRENLLYAGTEFGLFVSLDGGARWQAFQQGLPVTPVTDIKVHRKDLVLSTMGRSFWVLDDLSPLHQLEEATLREAIHLLAPRAAHRVRWVGSLERQFPGFGPEYPDTGAAIHYSLAADLEEELVLEVLDADGNLLRRFSSRSEARGETGRTTGMRPRFGGGQGSRLDTERGLHRFVWDLRHEGPKPLRGRGGFGGRGPLAVPATYEVRLSSGDWSATQSLELLIDPRVEAAGITQQDLESQLELAREVTGGIDSLRGGIRRIVSLRSEIEAVLERGKKADIATLGDDGELTSSAKGLIEQLDQIEALLHQREQGKVGAELEPELNGQLTYLYGMINGADQRPGQDAYDRWRDAKAELDGHLASLDQLVAGPLAELNTAIDELALPAVVVEAPDGAPKEVEAADAD